MEVLAAKYKIKMEYQLDFSLQLVTTISDSSMKTHMCIGKVLVHALLLNWSWNFSCNCKMRSNDPQTTVFLTHSISYACLLPSPKIPVHDLSTVGGIVTVYLGSNQVLRVLFYLTWRSRQVNDDKIKQIDLDWCPLDRVLKI